MSYKEYKKSEDRKSSRKARGTTARAISSAFAKPFLSYIKTMGRARSYHSALRRKPLGKKGRPKGPSGKYVIPGIGPVGVYEYRKWFNAQLRIQKMKAQQEMYKNLERNRVYAQRLRASQVPAERRTIPETKGQVSLGSLHKEADDYANLVD